jgi:hypothetical protein
MATFNMLRLDSKHSRKFSGTSTMTIGQATKNNRFGQLLEKIQQQVQRQRNYDKGAAQRHSDLFDGTSIQSATELPTDEKSGIDDRERKLLNLLKFCLLAGMGYFILGNIRPYIGFADQTLFQWKDTGIFVWVAGLPVIGWLLNGGFAIVGFVIGTILWAILQLSELLPTVLNDSPGFILAILTRIKSWQKLAKTSGDSKIATQLKERYNGIPEATIEKANLTRAIAYLFDAAICFNFYSPIEGGWGNLQTMLLTSDYSYLRLDQVSYIIVTLFAVEALYWVYKLVTGIIELYFENN